MNHLQIYHDYQGGAILPRCQAAPEIEPVRVRVQRKAGREFREGHLFQPLERGVMVKYLGWIIPGYGEILGLDHPRLW